ncbi:hypothetical protein DSO57_1036194 [Entomophthora muscae]|uniref:Uncharacterized protein n=1 Tax=Entomophthora muscae TaxID=34485 RepID=A0ACC2TB75_9FUNG|nr:hypothetical protein DSO57_1036194 [Entomophthora muscae]
MVLADEHHIAVKRETAPFSVMLENLHSTIQGPVINFPKFDIVLGLDWLQRNNPIMNAAIHHVLILPLMGYFEDKSLSFAFVPQNESVSKLGNKIFWFPNSAQLTYPTHACGD